MPTVTVEQPETPVQAEPVADSDSFVTDSKGRTLKIRRPNILQESRLVRAMGESAMNAAYMTGYVMPAVMVIEIDGEEFRFPSSQLEVDAALTRVGREGISAVMNYIVALAEKQGDDANALKK